MGRGLLSVSPLVGSAHRRRRRTKHKPSSPSNPKPRSPRRRQSSRRLMDEEGEEGKKKKRRVDPDVEIASVVDAPDNEDDRELEIVKEKKVVVEEKEEAVAATLVVEEKKEEAVAVVEVEFVGLKEEFRSFGDGALEEKIKRMKGDPGLTKRLPDKGEKLQLTIKRMEAEVVRRKLEKKEKLKQKDVTEINQPSNSKRQNFSGAANGLKQETPLSSGKEHSMFYSSFLSKPEAEQTQSRTAGSCKFKLNNNNKQMTPNRDRRGTMSDFSQMQEELSSRPINKSPTVHNPSKSETGNTVVCLDDEDPQLDDKNSSPDQEEPLSEDVLCQLESLGARFKESNIYYPSRDDPECVTISFTDMKCLEPQGYLSSDVMNFYIQYLRRPDSSIDRSRGDCHFFNTFFYNKLKVAVSHKGKHETAFAKLRRWWKGTNIFHKAYIFLPINEDLHWSLIIICMPDKGEQSGPIVLHLDSLQLHNSRQIFKNIKRFIKEEWDHLSEAGASSDLPWENLPHNIMEEKIMMVPQQRNEYDCGLFVLFFIQRFIKEAPDRLRRKDLQMFGKQWFRPAEASALRNQIRKLLLVYFEADQPKSTPKHGHDFSSLAS